jgi:HK97 family phage major capsid protein
VPVQNSVGAAAWTAEGVDATEAETTFTQLKFAPYKATRIVQISRELLSDSYVDMAGFMAGMFGRSFATLLNSAFVNGDGSSKPTGITDGTDLGVTAADADAITWDELQSLFYSLKEPYRANGTWLFNSTTAAEIRGLKADGRYIWEPSGQLGQPDLLLGRPVAINDDCEASTTGLKPVMFGDLSYYWITWREGMDFQRLDELYAVAGNVGLRSELRVDGKLTSGEAVKHIIMA